MKFVKIAGIVFNAEKVVNVQVINKGGTPATYGVVVQTEQGVTHKHGKMSGADDAYGTYGSGIGNFDTYEAAAAELDKLIA